MTSSAGKQKIDECSNESASLSTDVTFPRSSLARQVLGAHIHGKQLCKQSRPQEPGIFQFSRITHAHFYSNTEKLESTETLGIALSKGLSRPD